MLESKTWEEEESLAGLRECFLLLGATESPKEEKLEETCEQRQRSFRMGPRDGGGAGKWEGKADAFLGWSLSHSLCLESA